MLSTIVSRAVQLSDTDAGTIYEFDKAQQALQLRSSYGMSEQLVEMFRSRHLGVGEEIIDWALRSHEPVQIEDLLNFPVSPTQEILVRAGYRAVLVVPLLGRDHIIGVLVVRRKQPGAFPQNTVDLLKTFAAQSVLAIQNAHLFTEIDEKSRQLEIASQHKSQFLANMSHELRTPLNAILGYTELIIDNIYGETPEKMRGVLERLQANGKHLLGLINDVLDLSKIEAGQLNLELADYSLPERRAHCLYRRRVARHRKEARLDDRRSPKSAARPRRRAPPHAGAAQPRRQCHQVHRQGRDRDPGDRIGWIVHGRGA